MDYTQRLDELFNAAKENDEFEYACTLLNMVGMQDAGWDPLQETIYMFEDLIGLLSAPLNGITKERLALLLYCHLTEAEAVYKIIYNMLRVTQGLRSSAFPFEPLVRIIGRTHDRIEPTVRKIVEYIAMYADEIEKPEIAGMFRGSVNHELRNAFYHSDYTLYDGEFRSKGSWFTHADNVRSQVLGDEELTAIINAGVGLFHSFMTVYDRHRSSYTGNRLVRGRFTADDSYVDITLLANENGLYGFEGSSV